MKSIIFLKTKSVFVVAAFFLLARLLYSANPIPFATVNTPIGVAASATDLIVTEYCGQRVDSVDCQGNVTLLAILPGLGDCQEQYVSIAPAQSAGEPTIQTFIS